MIHWPFAGLTLFFCLLAPATSAEPQNSPFLWRNWDVSDGLAEEFTSAITRGPSGAVWINHGDTDEMSRVDGYEVSRIPDPGPTRIAIYEAPGGMLWSFSGDARTGDYSQWRTGLQRFIDSEWVRIEVPAIAEASETLKSSPNYYRDNFSDDPDSFFHYSNLRRLLPIDNDRIYILFTDRLSLFEARTGHETVLLEVSQTNASRFDELSEGREGKLLISGETGSVIYSPSAPDSAAGVIDMPLSADLELRSMFNLFETPGGRLYGIAIDERTKIRRALEWRGDRWQIISLIPEELSVFAIWTGDDESKRYILAYDKINYALDKLILDISGELLEVEIPDDVKQNYLFVPAFEENGNFWLNLYTSSGVARAALKTWRLETVPGYSMSDQLGATIEISKTSSGALYFVRWHHICIYEGGSWRTVRIPDDIGAIDRVASLHNDSILFNTSFGQLWRFSIQNEAFERIEISENLTPLRFSLARNGDLLIAFQSTDNNYHYYIRRYDGETFTPFMEIDESLDIGWYVGVYDSPEGDVWIYGSRGLLCYDKNGERVPEKTSSYPGTGVLVHTRLRSGAEWFGNEHGIYQYLDGAWSTILDDAIIRHMYQAGDDSIWVAADDEIIRYKEGTWVSQNHYEGLMRRNPVRDITEDDDGSIWLATDQGIYRYYAEADDAPPDTAIQPGSAIATVSPDGNAVFNLMGKDKWNFTLPERLLYSYKLNDGDWSAFDDQPSIYLNDLEAGQYTLSVKAMDRNWNIDPTPVVHRFQVLTPWYLQPGFIIVAGLLSTILLFRFINLEYLVRLRTAAMKREIERRQRLESMVSEVSEREQRRIGQDLHDGLSQLLAGALLLARRLQKRTAGKGALEEDYSNQIEDYLEKSVRFTRDLIRGMTPISIEHQGLDKALDEFALNINKLYGIECLCHHNSDINLDDTNTKTNVFRIVQESVNNAIKHGEANRITINTSKQDKYYRIEISDDGNGFDQSIPGKGMGLHIMRYRASLFDGKVLVKSEIGEGTSVICFIPEA